MTDSSRQADALLTEHLKYTPLTLIDDIINAVNTIVYRAIEAIENGLLSIPPKQLGFSPEETANHDTVGSGDLDYPEAQDEIENGVHQLETLLESTVDKAFDLFEIYTLRNVLTVPDELAPWMRLGHYEANYFSNLEASPTPDSILLLRRKVQETRKLNRALQSTHSRNAALIAQLNYLLSQPSTTTTDASSESSLAFLTSSTNAAAKTLNLSFIQSSKSANPLTTNAQFATSQLPALRKLVGELRPRLQNLKEGGGEKVDWESRREERRAYIESGVRRIVWKSGDGELEGLGGDKRTAEEVEGLENVVGGIQQGDRMEE